MLTARQMQVYRFIRHYILQHGISPTEKEVAQAINIKSRGVAHRYIKRLVEAGLLTRVEKRRRNLKLVEKSSFNDNFLPILGCIAAGNPKEYNLPTDKLNLTDLLFQPDHFVYQVNDDSLNSNYICSGDYIICQRDVELKQNDRALMILNNQLHVVEIINKSETVVALQNSQGTHEYSLADVNIIGKYKGLVRLNDLINKSPQHP